MSLKRSVSREIVTVGGCAVDLNLQTNENCAQGSSQPSLGAGFNGRGSDGVLFQGNFPLVISQNDEVAASITVKKGNLVVFAVPDLSTTQSSQFAAVVKGSGTLFVPYHFGLARAGIVRQFAARTSFA